ncbi:hypothetical protein Bca4012_024311 [Brassica carinata]
MNMEGSRERRERGDAAREAAYQPAIDDRRSHRLSNHTSLNRNPRTIFSCEPGLQTRLRLRINDPRSSPNKRKRGARPLRHRREPRANHR